MAAPWPLLGGILLAIRIVAGDFAGDLQTFGSGLRAPGGISLAHSWGVGTPGKQPCNFPGVQCGSGGQWALSQLASAGLSGTLSPGWAALPSFKLLTGLNLSGNAISGTLPGAWAGAFPLLQYLDLSCNTIQGQLPEPWQAGLGPKFTQLHLGGMAINGTLPISWATQQGWANLTLLDLSSQNLTGSIPPEWGAQGTSGPGLSALQQLLLHGNSLAGSLPADWVSDRPPAFARSVGGNLSALTLAPGNDLCGPVPLAGAQDISSGAPEPVELQPCGSEDMALALLEWADSVWTNFDEVAEDTAMFGFSNDTLGVPCTWAGVTCQDNATLFDLDFSTLPLHGSLQGDWDALSPWLWHLVLDGVSSLTGDLPDAWADFPHLGYISLGAIGGSINSSLPAAWGAEGAFPELFALFLHYNPGITGTISAWGANASAMPGMGYLVCVGCGLTGTIPASLGNLSQLQELWLQGQQGQGLTGTLPAWSGAQWPGMYTLQVGGNPGLTGSIPASWSTLDSLKVLNVSGTGLCGGVKTAGNASRGLQPLQTNLTACAAGGVPAPPGVAGTTTQGSSSSSVAPLAGGLGGAAAFLALVAIAAWTFRRQWQNPESLLLRARMAAGSSDGKVSATQLFDPPASVHTFSMRSMSSLPKEHSTCGLPWELDPSRLKLYRNRDKSLHRLGAGSYGQVFKAQLDGKEDVAVKVLAARNGLKGKDLQAFLTEVAVLYACRHEAIVQFVGAYLGQEHCYLVQELMACDLHKALNEPDLSERLRWRQLGQHAALSVASGLAFLHDAGVVHMDVSSANVLLSADCRAKLADTGLAVVLASCSYRTEVSVRGTYPYAAPEVLMGGRCSQAADSYSLGVLLHELVTQERPVRGRLRAIASPMECPASVESLIDACLHGDPAQRPTAHYIVHQLQLAL